ncbi:hypothetical protein [Amycolatopsis sp. NPDC004378]
MLKQKPSAPSVPQWLNDKTVSPQDRVLLLTYRIARGSGASRRRSARLCREMLRWHVNQQVCVGVCLNRTGMITALRAQLNEAGPGLETAIRDAVLLDELVLLPPRQRLALWAATVQHESVIEISRRTGWTQPQVSRLLRAALLTVGRHATG